jgi:hypothetical protein
VIVAEEMQHTVNGEMCQVIGKFLVLACRFAGNRLAREDDIAERREKRERLSARPCRDRPC